MSADGSLRGELKDEGRNLIEVAVLMMAVGCVIGSISSVSILLPIVPEVAAARSLVVGIGAGLLGAIALVIVYRLVEDRLIGMYLDIDTDDGGGETA